MAMRETYQEAETGNFDEHSLEIENRIKNLFWTVSGSYTLQFRPDLKAFARSKYTALYDAVKQGAFARYFDQEQLSLYIMKKLYCQAQEKPLMELAQLCVDAAVFPIIKKERLGIDGIRRKAFADMLGQQRLMREHTLFGKVKCVIMERFLGSDGQEAESAVGDAADAVLSLEYAKDTEDVICMIDKIYNTFFDRTFESRRGELRQILDIPAFEIARDAWQDCLSDEEMKRVMKAYLANLGEDYLRLDITDKPKTWKPHLEGLRRQNVEESLPDENAVKKVQEYVELNYGRSYLTAREQERKNYKLCKGIHRGCTLHFTEGILHAPVKKNNQYRFSQLQFEKNQLYYGNNHWIVKRNITALAETLQKALTMRREEDICRSTAGQLVPSRLWKLNRVKDEKLFDKKIRSQNSEFVVDILLDSSGSQSGRQSQTAVQGYIISEALSRVGIPHRVMSYCSFWGHTIMRRFRDYDDEREVNSRIFEFRASANNRDGLAIKAAHDALMEREEDFKILIVLSDGKPHDVDAERPGLRKPKPYCGEEAVKDTGFEVRKARASGVAVLGIFAGSSEDLAAEKKIYGKDFAYIRNLSNLSNIVGAYLRRQLERD